MRWAKDPEGDRLKLFENASEQRLDPALPIILRLDGRAFHAWTQGLDRPYDERLARLMVRVMLALAEEVGASYCYTQSDEITLVLHARGKREVPFSGRVQKLASITASLAGALFNQQLAEFNIVAKKLGTFDCRVYSVPDTDTAARVVLWREADAIRNSSLGRGQEFMSQNEMHGLSAKAVRTKVHEIGKGWSALPDARKFGTAYARRRVQRKFEYPEIQGLPANHRARQDPELIVSRPGYVQVALPLRWRATNPTQVIFDGADIDFKPKQSGEADEELK